MNNTIFVTSPLLPDLSDLTPLLEDIWQRKWITNNGYYCKELERRLADYLGVPYISLVANGTIALSIAIQILNLTGEVITTPYTFCATTHSLTLSNVTPVFCDIDPKTGNIDADKIEALITEKTSAILPVHCYGNPCEIDKIHEIAEKHNLKVIYDAAHAFAVKKDGKSLLTAGDLSCISFHATKTYNTIEGGGIVCMDKSTKDKIDSFRDFGIIDENTIAVAGMNGKMDEIRAAYGLVNLQNIDSAISKRKTIATLYRKELSDIVGISLLPEEPNTEYNYSYFPVFIDKKEYGLSSDELQIKLKQNNIFARRYFYPLISNLNIYSSLPSANRQRLPVANRMSNQVLCLPIHHDLALDNANKVIEVIKAK
ncbi:MAG: DegT/DnrJ/EryC1/StrS family aminotransferase [Treponema sp.]|nr:DegT/DnrJ/EryC1/StrS family aminotransferase [Treponema sp.]